MAYNAYDHENEHGWTCQGQHDKYDDAKALYCPKLSRNIVNYVERCFYMGVPIDVVCQMHVEQHVEIDVEQCSRYFFLTNKYVANIYACMRKGNYKLHKKDEMSANLWFQRQPNVFFLF